MVAGLAKVQSVTPSTTIMPEPTREVVVHLREVSIAYKNSRRRVSAISAVESINVDILRGEKFILLGPSGCGKSTLLMAIAGFIPLSSGVIEISGQCITGPSMQRIMVFQDFGQLQPWRTTLGNVEWAIRRRWPERPGAEIRQRARHYIELVSLGKQANQYPNTLSGGQKQRCAIARAFAAQPEILLMDEPFAALDAINREKMQAELNRLWGEAEPAVTVLFVTHDVNEAVHLGHRIMVMTPGPGRLRALIDNPHVGLPPYDARAMPIVSHLRELLKQD